MILNRDEVRDLYRRTARFYDGAVWMYRVTGATRLRERAIEALHLRSGDTVVDMGCGTGLNLPLLSRAVGPSGRVIGVDLTDAMLERAHRRLAEDDIGNVELVEADLAEYQFPLGMRGAVATFALEMVPEYAEVVRRVAASLEPGGRLVLFGLKHPERWPTWLIRIGIWLNRPFGVSSDYADLRPWEAARRYLHEVDFGEHYAGAAYTWVGEAT